MLQLKKILKIESNMRKLLYIILLLTSFRQLYSQFTPEEQSQLDSIHKIIQNKTYHDTLKAQAYVMLSEILATMNIDTVIYLCNKAEQIATKNLEKELSKPEKKSFKTILAAALNNIGYAHMNKSNYNLALKYYTKSNEIELENNGRKELASGYNNIGLIYFDLGDIPKAIEYYHKSLLIKEEFNDKKGIAMSLNNIGYVYDKHGDKKLALDYYFKGLHIFKELGNKKGLAMIYNNIGTLYFSQKKYLEALNYYKLSLNIRLELNDKKGMANCYQNLASIYLLEKNNDLSIIYNQKSLELRTEIEDKQGEAYSYIELGKIYMSLNEIKKAKLYAHNGYEIGTHSGFIDIIERASDLISKIALKEGDWKTAYEYHNLAIQMHDSVTSKASIKAIANQQAKYTYEKEKIIAENEQAKKDVITQQNQKTQRIIIISIAIGLILSLLFFALLYKRFRVTQKQNKIIQNQKHLIEVKHQEISDSIHYAERIQRTFLANQDLMSSQLKDYFILFKPKDVVSGDFYWASKLNNNSFAVVTGDSTGHGVPGAIMSLLNITSLEKAVEYETDPSQIFNVTRNIIINRLKHDGSEHGGKDGMDASICVYDLKNMILHTTAANNPIWIVRSSSDKTKEFIEIKPDKMPIGKHDKQHVSFTSHTMDIYTGDIIYTLTDGYPDQFGGNDEKKFMTKNLKNLILSIAHLPLKEQHEILLANFNDWKGSLEQIDDVCVIGVKI